MADSWEDWEDDNLVAGVSLNEVDESKFAGEDQQAPSTWDDDKPKTQPRKAPVESKYAAKDREYAEKVQTKGFVGEDKAARQAAVEEADIVAARELFGQNEPSKLDTMVPKNNVEFDEYAQLLISKYVLPHKNSKQWKYFIKSLVRQACEPLGKDEIKEVESAVAGVRSDKVKAELAAAKEAKKGAKKNLKMESDDIAAAMDYRGGTGVNNDDDYDFM